MNGLDGHVASLGGMQWMLASNTHIRVSVLSLVLCHNACYDERDALIE